MIDAKRRLLNNERARIQIRRERYFTTLELIRSLGGDWSAASDEEREQIEEYAKPAAGDEPP